MQDLTNLATVKFHHFSLFVAKLYYYYYQHCHVPYKILLHWIDKLIITLFMGVLVTQFLVLEFWMCTRYVSIAKRIEQNFLLALFVYLCTIKKRTRYIILRLYVISLWFLPQPHLKTRKKKLKNCTTSILLNYNILFLHRFLAKIDKVVAKKNWISVTTTTLLFYYFSMCVKNYSEPARKKAS